MRFAEFKTVKEDLSNSVFQLPLQIKSSTDIANLQKILAAFDYPLNVTGMIDNATINAIKLAHGAVSLPPSGTVDTEFVSRLNSALTTVPEINDIMGITAVSAVAPIKSNSTTSQPADTRRDDNKPAPTTASSKGRAVIIGNEKRTGGSISWRTNNPGNVMYGDRAKRFGAIGSVIAGDGEPVAIMPTLDHGWKMQIALWRSPTYNNGTIEQGCKTWAVGVRHYKGTSPYTISLADAAGASKNTKVSDLSDEQLKNMVKRQAKWEGFKVGTVTTV
jgi:hypothetical protein